MNAVAHTIVGVAAQTFDTRELGRIDLWVPMQLPATGTDGAAWFRAAARLKPGVSLQQAQAALDTSTASFDRVAVGLGDNVRFGAVPFKDALIATESSTLFRNDPRTPLWLLFGCVPRQRSWGEIFKIVGRDDGGRPYSSGADVTISTADYFDVFDVPVVRGRTFDEHDNAGSTPVIVINRALANRMWPDGQEPIGQKIRIGGGHDEPEREVIGIVENVRQARLDLVRSTMYMPLAQISSTWLKTLLPGDSLAWIVRTRSDALGTSGAVRNEIQRSTAVPVTDIAAMSAVVADSTARQRANMLPMTVLGGVALLLAAIGVYGLVAYSVRERTREIGIRMALGARSDRIVGMVLRQGLVLVLVGTALGLTAAYLSAGLLASILYGVGPRNVAVFVSAPLVLGFVALVAAAIPAYRASRVDPLETLRYE